MNKIERKADYEIDDGKERDRDWKAGYCFGREETYGQLKVKIESHSNFAVAVLNFDTNKNPVIEFINLKCLNSWERVYHRNELLYPIKLF